MIDALTISQIVLFIIVLVLSAAVAVLARQVGLLHERISPTGALALSKGPSVGADAPKVAALSLSGKRLAIGEASARAESTLLFFLSPSCPVCKTLLPTLERVVRDQRVRLILASDGAELDHRGFAESHGLDPARYVVSRDLGLEYQIAKLPYAVLIDADGIVRAQGIVNTREHLESLFEAEERGVASIQEYLKRELPVVANEGAKA